METMENKAKCPFFVLDEETGLGTCELDNTVFDPTLCNVNEPESMGTGCPGDASDEHVVVSNVPNGVTIGVSWRVVSRHPDFESAAREAAKLNEESTWNDRGRMMWSGYAFHAIHHSLLENVTANRQDPCGLEVFELFELSDKEEGEEE